MSNKNSNKKKSVEQQDFVSFEPEPVKLMPMEKMRSVREYFWTLKALREGPKTAKEVHKDVAKLGQKFTLKTIYRHLKKLQEHGFATVVGHRQKTGARIPEKLYHRTAHVFFLHPKEEIKGTAAEEEGRVISEAVALLLCGLFQAGNHESSALGDVVFQFLDTQRRIRGELLERATSNEELMNIFTETEMEKLNFYSDIATMITTFLRHPELLEQFNNLLSEET